MKTASLLLTAALLSPGSIRAQEQEKTAEAAEAEEAEEAAEPRHRISIGLGHEHISQGEVEGDTEWLSMASWVFAYDYRLAPRWAIGLHGDIILEQFVVETGDDEELERSYPLTIVPVAIFKATGPLSIVGGVGAEYADSRTLWLTRLGLELGWEVGRRWEVGGEVVWDAKWDYYDSWGLALVVSRRF